MSVFKPKISELLIESQKNKATAKVFISEEDETLGILMGIILIDSVAEGALALADTMAHELKENFYRLAEITSPRLNQRLKNSGVTTNIETHFEKALQEVNQKLAELIEREEISLDLTKLHYLIGVLKGNFLLLTQQGSLQAYLIHRTQQDSRMINILGATSGTPAKSTLVKIFSNIINGKIASNDSLFFCNESVTDFISLDKIKKTILTYSADASTEHLKNLLKEVGGEIPFVALVIKMSPEKISSPELLAPKIKMSPQASVEELLETQDKTEKLLTPSLALPIKKYFFITFSYLRKLIFKRKKRYLKSGYKPKDFYRSFSREKKEASQVTLQKFFNQTLRIFQKTSWLMFSIILKLLKSLWQVILIITGNKKVDLKIKTWGEKTSQELARGKDKTFGLWQQKLPMLLATFKRLPRASKILLITSLIFVLLFIQSLIWLAQKQRDEEKRMDFERLLNLAQEKSDAAQASLIYKDEKKSKKLLEEAQKLLLTLPPAPQGQEEKYENLQKDVTSRLEEIRHIARIDSPRLVGTFSWEGPPQNILSLAKLNNNIYGFTNNTVYRLNRADGQITKEKTFEETIFQKGFLTDENSILFLESPLKVSQFDLESKILTKVEVAFSQDSEIKDLEVYNQKLYLLDIKNNQIWRHSQGAFGYITPQAWIQDEKVDLIGAVDMTIDGFIYVLKKDGTIYKILTGKLQEFAIQNLDPYFSDPTKIHATPESHYLYILDPPHKRLVVLEKTGLLKVQYFSEKFGELKDFVIKEEEKKIYLLNGSEVYEIPASHLE